MEKGDKARRDFLFLGTGAVAVGGLTMFARPLFAHMAPAADSLEAPWLDVNLSKLLEGEQMTVTYLGLPVAIRYRTPDEIAAAQADDDADLFDPQTDQERLRPKPDGTFDPRFLVFHPICTHFGCVVVGEAGNYDGWYCPCHGSHFDTSGRVRNGPAPLNLEIPDYVWRTDTSITLRKRSIFTPS